MLSDRLPRHELTVSQLDQESFGVFHIGRVETFGEPTAKWFKEGKRLRVFAVGMPMFGEACSGPQLHQWAC